MANPNFVNEEWNRLVTLVNGDRSVLTGPVSGHRYSFVRPETPTWLNQTLILYVDGSISLPPGYKVYEFYQGETVHLRKVYPTYEDAIDDFINEMITIHDQSEEDNIEFWDHFLKYAIKLWYVIKNAHRPTNVQDIVRPLSKLNIVEIYRIFFLLLRDDRVLDYTIPHDDEYQLAIRDGHLRIRTYELPTENQQFVDLNAN
jgi:hypothetical protein